MIKKLTILALALIAACMAACAKEAPKRGDERVPVTVAVAEQKDIPVQITTIGSVQPLSTVAVRAQVDGQLLTVAFREGQDVRRGQLLFTIDPRPYEAAVAQARAALARDEAQLRNAESEAARYAELVKKDYVTREEYDKFTSSAEAARAVVASDRAAVQNTELKLAYCRITAPLDGRTGSLQVHPGNLVQANATTPLVVINQVEPVYVQFSVPERDLSRIRGAFGSESVPVTVTPQGSTNSIGGKLSFVDNAVDPATGTITLKGTFDNASRVLWPGQYVTVAVTLANRANSIVIPAQAVQNGQKGTYVYVVKQDKSVEMRPVSIDSNVGQQAIVDHGVQGGETVVIDGQLRLTPKSKVDVKEAL